jgi:hypothetical protein
MIKERIVELFKEECTRLNKSEMMTFQYAIEKLKMILNENFVEQTVLEKTPLEITVLREKDEEELNENKT